MGIARASLFLTLVLTTGCYKWVPYDGPPVPAGTEIRVNVSAIGSDQLRRTYGPNDGSVSGPVALWTDGDVSLLTQTRLTRPGFAATTITDTVRVPSSYVVGIDVKELDTGRTVLLSAGVLAGAAAVLFATKAFGGEDDGGEGGGPPVDASPIVRIPISLGGR